MNNSERAVGYISKNYLIILLENRKFYDIAVVKEANSQAVLHNHGEEDDPYACEDMLDLDELPIAPKADLLDWMSFRRSYTS